jgi:hypothetical protein
MLRRRRLPTDREIIDVIYEEYYPAFAKAPKGPLGPYIAVDIAMIAERLKVHPDIVFGRLSTKWVGRDTHGGRP